MQRVQDWPERLARYLAARAYSPFVWGQHDCCLFACDAVQAMTGVDLAADFRGKYSDAISALRAVKEFAGAGVGALAAKIAEQHGIPEISTRLAQRGDVVLLNVLGDGFSRQETLGLVDLSGNLVVSVGELCLQHVPMADAIAAWRIG